MIISIVGSRGFTDYETFCNKINELNLNITKIISGGAIGVDTLAERYAHDNNIEIEIIRPNYADKSVSPKVAPLIRNRIIVDKCDYYVAFWDMISGGTGYTITYANKIGRKGTIINLTQL